MVQVHAPQVGYTIEKKEEFEEEYYKGKLTARQEC